jgi:hypothetical protein
VPLADGDLVDGDLLEFVQLGLAKAALQGTGLDVLDHVPTDLEMFGHILDGHVAGQFQDITLEGAGVVLLGVGKAEFDLADLTTAKAQQAWNLEADEGGFAADGQGVENAFDAALVPDLSRAAVRAALAFAGLFDAKGHLTSLECLTDIVVANEAEGVVQ